MPTPKKRHAFTQADLVRQLRRHRALESIAERGFCEIPWHDIAPTIKRIRQGFWYMLDKDAARSHFEFPLSSYPRDELGDEMEFGLLEKRLGAAKAELTALERAEGRTFYDANKWRFHFSHELLARLSRHHTLFFDYEDFFGACTMLNMAAFHLARALAELYDEGTRLTLREQIEKSHAVTRLLRYESVTGTKPDATIHRDRSVFTIHWISSHPGLALFNASKERYSANETSPTSILIFPGKKFWGITRGKCGTGTLHGVHDERRHSTAGVPASRVHRFAAVSFVHAALYPGDVAWMKENISQLRIDPKDYSL